MYIISDVDFSKYMVTSYDPYEIKLSDDAPEDIKKAYADYLKARDDFEKELEDQANHPEIFKD